MSLFPGWPSDMLSASPLDPPPPGNNSWLLLYDPVFAERPLQALLWGWKEDAAGSPGRLPLPVAPVQHVLCAAYSRSFRGDAGSNGGQEGS